MMPVTAMMARVSSSDAPIAGDGCCIAKRGTGLRSGAGRVSVRRETGKE
jgi:hypothetical protein